VEGDMLVKLTNANIPYFNAGIFLENKTKIGKVDEILGPINQVRGGGGGGGGMGGRRMARRWP